MQIKEKQKIIEQINLAFGKVPRPKEFVNNPYHCEECGEHNDTLSQTNRDEIGLKELNNPGWDPICFVKPQAFLYYFPALVRLVFDDKSNNEYLWQFLFHCTYEGTESRLFCHFNREQISATRDLMYFLKYNWKKKIEKMCLTKDVDKAVKIWDDLMRDIPPVNKIRRKKTTLSGNKSSKRRIRY